MSRKSLRTSGLPLSSQRGMSAIELMIVAAIIMILVGIAVYVLDHRPKVRVKEAEVFVQSMARWAKVTDFETDQTCTWQPEGPPGLEPKAWTGILIGSYQLKPDGNVRCRYCLEVVLPTEDDPTEKVWAMAACDVDGDSSIRYYIVSGVDDGKKPDSTDGLAGLFGTTTPKTDTGAVPVLLESADDIRGSTNYRHARELPADTL